MPKSDKPPSFEEQLARLEAIVQKLENRDVALEESLQLYKEGVRLAAGCQKTLENARLTVEKLSAETGQPEPFPETPEARRSPA